MKQAAPEPVERKPALTVYIGGPMTGLPNHNFEAFAAAADQLRANNIGVINPAEHFNGDQSLDYTTYMRADLAALLEVDGIFVLPGWENSKGACLEVAVGLAIGLPVYPYDGTLPDLKLTHADKGAISVLAPVAETILEEAERYVGGTRNQDYGHPLDDMTRTATLWGAILGIPDAISAEQVALCMIAVKISRLCNDISKRDSQVDIAGYARCIERMQRRRAGKE